LRTLTDHSEKVKTVAFESTHLLASAFADKTIELWDKNSGGLLRTHTDHGGTVDSVAFDSNYLVASGSDDDTIKIWNKNWQVF